MKLNKSTLSKVQCNICGAIIEGYESDFGRHLRLRHKMALERNMVMSQFTPTDSTDTPVITTKAILKLKNKIANLKRKQESNQSSKKLEHKSIYWKSVIKTPCGSK